jgi:hypothetical protein
MDELVWDESTFAICLEMGVLPLDAVSDFQYADTISQ